MVALIKLDFTGSIAAKGSSTDTIRSRLKDLHQKLEKLNQDDTDVKSLHAVRKQLLDKPIFLHKDKGIKAYCACCLADMLRLYAPEPPYTEEQLKDVFVFMLTQISHHLKVSAPSISTSKSRTVASTGRITEIPYYAEYCFLLDSLATIRSISLVTDLPGGDELMRDWFVGLFSIVRSDMSKQLLRSLQEIMTALLDEATTLPEGLLEDILLQQLNVHYDNPQHPAFRLAIGVMRNSAPKLQRQLYAYISDIHDGHGKDPSDEDMAIMQKTHETLCLVFRHAPEVLLNVIPHMEEVLQGGSLRLRILTTRTLGTIFGSPSVGATASSGHQSIAESYHSTWQMWLGRRADKSVSVRVAWVESVGDILLHQPELRPIVEVAILEKLTDVEDKVRAATCKLFGAMEYEVAAHHIDVETLKSLGDRLRDKKTAVSEQAFTALGRLYSAAFVEIESHDVMIVGQFAWIPQAIYKSLAENASIAQREQVEYVTAKFILPLPSPKVDSEVEGNWVDRLLVVCAGLTEDAFDSLMSLTNLTNPALAPWDLFIKASEMHNVSDEYILALFWRRLIGLVQGGVVDQDEQGVKSRLEQITGYLASQFAEPHRTEKALSSFATLNDQRLYKLFRTLIATTTDLEGVVKTQAEVLKRLESSLPDVVPVFKRVLRKASFWIINRSSISVLLARAKKAEPNSVGLQARRLLLHIGKRRPELLLLHTPELQIMLSDKRQTASADVALICLAQAAIIAGDKCVDLESRTIERLKQMSKSGSALQSKFSVRLLCAARRSGDVDQVLQSIVQTLRDSGSGVPLLACLSAIKELFKQNAKEIQQHADELLDLIDSEVLQTSDPVHGDEKWKTWDDLDTDSQARVLAIKVYIQYCLMGLPTTIRIGHRNTAIISRLHFVVANVGQVKPETRESGALAGHLRLVAAIGLTKLATYREYDKLIANACFEEIAYQIQDAYYAVRAGYLEKLHKYLLRRKHSPRWYILPFLVAHDVEQDIKDLGVKIAREVQMRLTDELRLSLVEKPFVRLFSLLAHHPDFENTNQEDLIAMSHYINLYLDEVANQRNVGLLYHLANRIKTVRDVKQSGNRLYMLSELAQLLLQQKASAQQWSIDEYTGKQSMPADVFAKLPNEEVSKQISRKQFLPDDFARQLQATAPKKTAKTSALEAQSSPKAVKVTRPRKTPAAEGSKRKRRHASESDNDNDTAGEETPDTDDYEDQDDDFGRVRVRPAPKGRKAKQETQRKRRRRARAGSKGSDSSDLTELSD